MEPKGLEPSTSSFLLDSRHFTPIRIALQPASINRIESGCVAVQSPERVRTQDDKYRRICSFDVHATRFNCGTTATDELC